MSLAFAAATPPETPAIAALRNAVADDLTARHGRGWWSGQCTGRGVAADMRQSEILVAREGARIVATLRLLRHPFEIAHVLFVHRAKPCLAARGILQQEFDGSVEFVA